MKTKLIVMALALVAVLVGCGGSECKRDNKVEPIELVGKKVRLVYPTMTAKVSYLSENELHWQTTEADGAVAEGVENFIYKRIEGNIFFLNWIEADGTTVSQVLDWERKRIQVYLSYSDAEEGRGGRAGTYFEGDVELIEE